MAPNMDQRPNARNQRCPAIDVAATGKVPCPRQPRVKPQLPTPFTSKEVTFDTKEVTFDIALKAALGSCLPLACTLPPSPTVPMDIIPNTKPPVQDTFTPPVWARAPSHPVRLACLGGGKDTDGKGKQDEDLQDFDLEFQSAHTIGRAVSSNIILREPTVSRRHAAIVHNGQACSFILDLGSAHGTYVNGQRLLPNIPVKLRRGSLLRFGNSNAPLFVFRSYERINLQFEEIDDMTRQAATAAATPCSSPDVKHEVRVVCGHSGVVCIGCSEEGRISDEESELAKKTLYNTLQNSIGNPPMAGEGAHGDMQHGDIEQDMEIEADLRCKNGGFKRSFDETLPPVAAPADVSPSNKCAKVAPAEKKSVRFSAEKPTEFFAYAITPDDSEEEAGSDVGETPPPSPKAGSGTESSGESSNEEEVKQQPQH